MRLPPPVSSTQQHGLTRGEWLWTFLLLGVIVATIVGTLHAEVERGKQRLAADTLAYLASQIYWGLERGAWASPEDLHYPLLGPGSLPEGLPSSATQGDLQDFVPNQSYLPIDPWGHAYVLLLGTDHGQKAPFLLSAGKTGVIPQQVGANTPLAHRVHWPPR